MKEARLKRGRSLAKMGFNLNPRHNLILGGALKYKFTSLSKLEARAGLLCSHTSPRQLVVLGVWGRKEKSIRTKRARQVQPLPESQSGIGPKSRTLNVSDAPRYLWGRKWECTQLIE